MQRFNAGLKVIWNITSWLSVDAAYDRYLMRGLDHITPQDRVHQNNTFTVGTKTDLVSKKKTP